MAGCFIVLTNNYNYTLIYSLKEQVDKYHKEGTHVPQLEQRMIELKDFLKVVVHADEVDPNNEWAIKANQLL